MSDTVVRVPVDGGPPGRAQNGRPRGGPGGMRGHLWRRVSLWPLLAGLLTVVVAVVGISALLADRGSVTTIWVAAREIKSDASLQPEDLTSIQVSGPVRFEHLAVSDMTREAVLGGVPRVDIPAGSPLAPAQFYGQGAPAPVPTGSVTVAVVVNKPHLPANVDGGDHVLLIGAPEANRPEAAAAGWPGAEPIQQDATVVAVTESATTSEVTVTVSVPRDVAADVAWLAAQGRLVVARDR